MVLKRTTRDCWQHRRWPESMVGGDCGSTKFLPMYFVQEFTAIISYEPRKGEQIIIWDVNSSLVDCM